MSYLVPYRSSRTKRDAGIKKYLVYREDTSIRSLYGCGLSLAVAPVANIAVQTGVFLTEPLVPIGFCMLLILMGLTSTYWFCINTICTYQTSGHCQRQLAHCGALVFR